MSEPCFDIAGHALGQPARTFAVRTKDDLRAAFDEARASGRAFAATGALATYWHNLDLSGAVVADLTAYGRVIALDEENGYVSVESGITIRALDQQLRARGFHLAMHPDAYGDTSVGSAIANGVTGGIGMMRGDFLDQVVGFEAMLPDGRVVQVGASRVATARRGPVSRGIPDLRSLFFGAEGALGVVTEVDLALLPTPWEARVVYRVDDDRGGDALRFAAAWRRRGAVDTIRWVWDGRGELMIAVSSGVDRAELDARVAHVIATLPGWLVPEIDVADDEQRRGVSPAYDRKWPGPVGTAQERVRRFPFFGIDGVVPYARARDAYAWAQDLELRAPHHRRVVMYFGPDGVNVGLHCNAIAHADHASARAQLEAYVDQFATFDAVPYRPGLVWADGFRRRADADTLGALRDIARVLDPDARVAARVGTYGTSPS